MMCSVHIVTVQNMGKVVCQRISHDMVGYVRVATDRSAWRFEDS